MKPLKGLIAVALLAVAPVACAQDPRSAEITKPSAARWQLHSSVYGLTKDGKVVSRSENTLLIDSETGKTWILWPAKDAPYSWIELPQRKDGPDVRK